MKIIKKLCLNLVLIAIWIAAISLVSGCDADVKDRVDSVVEYELTMYFKDGTTKTFTGHSVHRDNTTGEWSYIKADRTKKTFVGEVKIRPVLKTSPRGNFETLAEEPQATKTP